MANGNMPNGLIDKLTFDNQENVRLMSDLIHNTIDILAIKLDKSIASLNHAGTTLHDTVSESITSGFKKKYNI